MAIIMEPHDTIAKEKPMHVQSIGLKSKSLFGVIEQIKSGLPMGAFDNLRQKIGLSERALSESMDISKRTLTRRKTEGRLSSSESERLVRLARLFDKATEVFGNDEAVAAQWFKTPARGLGAKTPLEMAETELGAQEVNALLVRIEHGVFPG
jgi:putative toxin-antitoxin system antitoxin component (TIGR02293 family)